MSYLVERQWSSTCVREKVCYSILMKTIWIPREKQLNYPQLKRFEFKGQL